jgi:hypothetical protein
MKLASPSQKRQQPQVRQYALSSPAGLPEAKRTPALIWSEESTGLPRREKILLFGNPSTEILGARSSPINSRDRIHPPRSPRLLSQRGPLKVCDTLAHCVILASAKHESSATNGIAFSYRNLASCGNAATPFINSDIPHTDADRATFAAAVRSKGRTTWARGWLFCSWPEIVTSEASLQSEHLC